MKKIIVITLGLAFTFCSTKRLTKTNDTVYWVNSIKVSCTGVAPMQCLQIQNNDNPEPGEWQNFYANIEGFNFQSGYIYKLLVNEKKVNSENIPADASSIKYSLIKVLEKTPDPKFRINDIWALEAINGETVSIPKGEDEREIPVIEINLAEMRIMGSDGCNRFQGQVNTIEEELIAFGPLAGTQKMCMEMDLPDKFNTAMQKIGKYKIENLNLYFYDNSNYEILRFKKVD